MYSVFLTIQQTVAQAADTAQEAVNQTPTNDIIGIGGIVATILVGVITCFVTWKLTMKSIKQLKLSWNMQVIPILANSVTKNAELNLVDFKIQYGEKRLSNPCLLALEIVNTGNEAISDPPIRVRTDEATEIISAYLEDIPSGYEELWQPKITESNICEFHLKHINQKQVVRAKILLDNLPQKKVIFECPMINVQVQELPYSYTSATEKRKLILRLLEGIIGLDFYR